MFIPIDFIGGTFKKATDILPFYHSLEAIRTVLNGNYGEVLPHLMVVIGYTVVIFILAMIAFQRKMSGDEA